MCSMGCVYLTSIRCEWIFGQGVYCSGPRRGKVASGSWATSSIAVYAIWTRERQSPFLHLNSRLV